MNHGILRQLLCPSLRRALGGRTRRTLATLSYVHCPSDQKLEALTIGQALERAVNKTPDKTACIFMNSNSRKTMQQLFEDVERVAAGLMALKIGRGDRLAVWGTNSYEWLLMQHATARAGIILVSLNPAARYNELLYSLQKVECKALVAGTEFRSHNYLPILRQLFPNADESSAPSIHSDKVPSLKTLVLISKERSLKGATLFSELLQAGSDRDRSAIRDLQSKLSCDDPINIQFTSEPSGNAKAATLSHFGLVNTASLFGKRLQLDNDSGVLCNNVPFYNILGMVAGTIQLAASGATILIPNGWFDAESALRAVHIEKITAMCGIPTMFMDMMNHPKFSEFNLSNLRRVIVAGAPSSRAFLQYIRSKMRVKEVLVGYGVTETCAAGTLTPQNATDEQMMNTVGTARPHIQIKVVDGFRNIVPRGQLGEVCIRGYPVMLGYWNDEEANKRVLDKGGWFHTGDLGVLRDDDSLQVVGRVEDVIVRGGENVSPMEIEQAIMQHGAVAEAQVVGVPDKRMGEDVCAFIILRFGASATEEEIKKWLETRVSKFKVPKYFIFVTQFPLTATGRVRKFKLRENAIKVLKLR